MGGKCVLNPGIFYPVQAGILKLSLLHYLFK